MGRTQLDPVAALLPCSTHFEIRQTAYSGRGVFASQHIPAGQHVYSTSPTPVHVLYRIFRREVCGWCFAYDGGRTYKIATTWNGVSVQWFCSDVCRDRWDMELGELGRESWAILEGWLKKAKIHDEEGEEDQPSSGTVDAAWETAERDGSHLLAVRQAVQQTKADRRSLSRALNAPAHPDTISFLLSGILAACTNPSAFALLRQLEGVSTPYRSTAQLHAHLASYQTLLALLPVPLLSHVTPDILRTLSSVDAHNSFGIWSDAPGRGEMLGYGIWPDASFFNHSCHPVIAQRVREGRTWSFVASRDAAPDEEVTISYLSADELRELNVEQRRQCLQRNWGFVCMCARCVEESI
ncbi:SET domain-containing protein [Auricularia subglabra TFB-10046 SS5]|nr:SET domain-containing protein [Auricularia subglabra TFB-10046 SS5]